MHLNRKALLFVFLAVCLLAAAEENNNVDDQEIDKSSVAPVSQNIYCENTMGKQLTLNSLVKSKKCGEQWLNVRVYLDGTKTSQQEDVELTKAEIATSATLKVAQRKADNSLLSDPSMHNASGMNIGGDIIIPGNLVKMVLNGGAVAAGVMIFTALATLVWPVLATKMCHVFGTCGEIYPASSYANTAYQQPDYGQASYGQTFNNPTNYQKRSIEYISPVLKALGNAYEKYNHVSASASANKAA